MSDSSLKDSDVIEAIYGLIAGFYALSGGIGGLIILRWIGIAGEVKAATAPLGVAGEVILGLSMATASFALLSWLLATWPR